MRSENIRFGTADHPGDDSITTATELAGTLRCPSCRATVSDPDRSHGYAACPQCGDAL